MRSPARFTASFMPFSSTDCKQHLGILKRAQYRVTLEECPAVGAAIWCRSSRLRAVLASRSAQRRGNARRALRQRRRVVNHALDLAHDEAEHPVRKVHSKQRQRVAGVL